MGEEIPVVAAVWERGGRLLLGLRPTDKRHGGMWEFPGGKVAPRETPAAALARELREELGVQVLNIGAHLVSFRDPDSPFRIDFYPVASVDSPQPIEHGELRWVTLAEAEDLPLAPSDARMIEWLCAQEGLTGPVHPAKSTATEG